MIAYRGPELICMLALLARDELLDKSVKALTLEVRVYPLLLYLAIVKGAIMTSSCGVRYAQIRYGVM